MLTFRPEPVNAFFCCCTEPGLVSPPSQPQAVFSTDCSSSVPHAHPNLCLLLERKHDAAGAITHLTAAYQTKQDDSGVVQHLALDLVAVGRLDEAETLLAHMPQDVPSAVLRQLSRALLEKGDDQQAIPLLERLHNEDPSREIDERLASALIGVHEDARALELLQPKEASGHDGETDYLIGLAQADRGATHEAITAFTESIQANPHNSRAFHQLALIEAAEPQTIADAGVHLRAALRLEPVNADYALALGRVFLEENDAAKALPVLREIQAAGTRAGERDLLLGIAQIIVSGPLRAIAALQSAVTEAPAVPLSYDMLGFCYFSQGEMPRAAAAYARASDLAPTTTIFARSAAIAFEHSGNTDRALAFARRAAGSVDARAMDHEILGRLLAQAGRPAEAIKELTMAISADPDLEPALFLLGRTLMQTGDQVQAMIWFGRLQELKSKQQAGLAARGKTNPTVLHSSILLRGAPVATEPNR